MFRILKIIIIPDSDENDADVDVPSADGAGEPGVHLTRMRTSACLHITRHSRASNIEHCPRFIILGTIVRRWNPKMFFLPKPCLALYSQPQHQVL